MDSKEYILVFITGLAFLASSLSAGSSVFLEGSVVLSGVLFVLFKYSRTLLNRFIRSSPITPPSDLVCLVSMSSSSPAVGGTDESVYEELSSIVSISEYSSS